MNGGDDGGDAELEPPNFGSCSVLEVQGSLVTSDSGGQPLKIEGSIASIPIFILVDSGATHNFISRNWRYR